MIFFITRGHDYPHCELRDLPHAPRTETIPYLELIRQSRIRRATYIFTDLDWLNFAVQRHAAKSCKDLVASGSVCLNDPARMRGRYALLKRLHAAGINDFDVYRIDAGEFPTRYPVFVRSEYGREGPLTDLLPSRDGLSAAVDQLIEDGHPERHLIAVEYANEPIRPGLFRTYKMFRIKDAVFAHPSDHEKTWSSKANSVGLASEDLYEQELRMCRENPFQDVLRRAFEIAQIEYGRADFGLVNGKVQIYEINTNPSLEHEDTHPFPVRRTTNAEFWTNYLRALTAADVRKSSEA